MAIVGKNNQHENRVKSTWKNMKNWRSFFSPTCTVLITSTWQIILKPCWNLLYQHGFIWHLVAALGHTEYNGWRAEKTFENSVRPPYWLVRSFKEAKNGLMQAGSSKTACSPTVESSIVPSSGACTFGIGEKIAKFRRLYLYDTPHEIPIKSHLHPNFLVFPCLNLRVVENCRAL